MGGVVTASPGLHGLIQQDFYSVASVEVKKTYKWWNVYV